MLYTEEAVRANIRNREGQRVFFLGRGDTLTPGARDYLSRERIAIRSGEEAKIEVYQLLGGGYATEKPEHMTHLRGNILVPKTHPVIAFRGAIDILEGEILLCQVMVPDRVRELEEILSLARMLIRCDVMEEPVPQERLLGMTEGELRSRSHFPQDHYGQPHFMPSHQDGPAILWLNRTRSSARAAELAAARAFRDENGNCTRTDILRALNRMSSALYLLMIQEKAGKK